MHLNYDDHVSMSRRTPEPHFLAFEGPDGGGKTTLLQAVLGALKANGVAEEKISTCNFPSTLTAPGQLIRKVFRGDEKMSPRGMAYLLLADLVERDPEIRRDVSHGKYILCDRHPLVSGFVYQGEVYTQDAISAMQYRSQFYVPDLTFILDIPPEVMEERINQRAIQRNEMYEQKDRGYQQRLRARYVGYAYTHFHNTVLLDGTKPIATLVDQVLTAVLQGGSR